MESNHGSYWYLRFLVSHTMIRPKITRDPFFAEIVLNPIHTAEITRVIAASSRVRPVRERISKKQG